MIKILKQDYKKIIGFNFAIILSAINFNLLLKPINLVSGGAGGLALVLENIFHISTSHLITIIYIITFALGVIFLDKKTVASIIYGSILYPIVIYFTEDITSIIRLDYNDIFLICIVSGIISGITNGIIFKYNFSAGGLNVIAPIFNKYFKLSISYVNFIVNTITVFMGGYFYGFNMVIYAIVLLYVSSYVCNMVILGVSNNKVLLIKSKKNDQIIKMLHNKYKINSTILDDDKNNNTLMVVIKNIEYNFVKYDLKRIDKNIFYTANNCYEVRR